MKAHNPIDDLFQQHFAETAIPMNNQEELWSRISGKKDDKNRGFLWFSLLGLAFCVAAGFTLINSNQSSDQNTLSNNISTTLDYTTQGNANNNQIITSDFNENKTIEEKEVVQSKVATNPKSEEPKKTRIIKSVIPLIEKTKSVVLQKVTSNLDHPMVNLPSNTKIVESSVVSEIEKPMASNYQFIDSELENTQLSNNTPPVYSQSGPWSRSVNNQSDSWSRCEVKTPGHFFVDVYGQAGLPLDKIELSQDGSDQTTYRDLWDTRFDPKASWHGGAQIGYEFRNGLRVSAGAEYQELVTQYSDNQRITETIRVYDPQAYFTIDMNGDRVWVGDTVTAINIYDRKFVRKNTHTLLHIPLQLSYDIYTKPGLHVAVDVAAALNVSKTYEGQYIRSDQTLIMIDENNQDNYISKDIGLSFSVGLHVGKYLNDNWEVYASPRFRYNPNSYLLDTETLKITRNMIGLRAGVRYHF